MSNMKPTFIGGNMSFLGNLFGKKNQLNAEKFYSSSVISYKSFTEELSNSPITSRMKYSKSEVLLFVASIQIATYFSFAKNVDTLIVKDFIHLVGRKMSEQNNYSAAQLKEFFIHFDEVIMNYCPHIEDHYKLTMSSQPSLKYVYSLTDEFTNICLPPNSSPLYKPQIIVAIGHLLVDAPRQLLT